MESTLFCNKISASYCSATTPSARFSLLNASSQRERNSDSVKTMVCIIGGRDAETNKRNGCSSHSDHHQANHKARGAPREAARGRRERRVVSISRVDSFA